MLLCFIVMCCTNRVTPMLHSCQNDQIRLKFCESPCVVQVGLSIVRVTFDNYLVKRECVPKAFITYWLTNSTEDTAQEIALDNQVVWKQDCTYHRHYAKNITAQTQLKLAQDPQSIKASKNISYIRPVENDNRYIYLDGLTTGETYSIKTNVKLTRKMGGKWVKWVEFSSLTSEITLSNDESFKGDGLVGHVNQGRCCEIRNRTYLIDKRNGECMLHTSLPPDELNLNTYIIYFFIVLVVIFIIIVIFTLNSIAKNRRCNQIARYETAEVSFKSTDPDEIYQEVSLSNQSISMIHKLLKSPTVQLRLPPDGEELVFEELKTRLKRRSI